MEETVPRIADEILDCVVYLYPSVADAESGEAAGGTGFLVYVPSSHEGYGYVYCVTNSHVIREGASPVIRLNTSDGGKGIVPLTEDSWVHHRDGDDLAACSLVVTEPDRYRFNFVPTTMFLTQEIIKQHNIGPGDDVFMVGRFVSHERRQRNTPLVRFGNISMMPHEPVMHPRGITQESFLVETRSLGGFSGSPVFVQIELAKRKESSPVTLDISPEEIKKTGEDANTFTRDDFLRDLKKVARKQDRPSQPGSETH